MGVMNTLSAREILEQVAAGRLDPAEAARLLDQLDDARGQAPADADAGTTGATGSVPGGQPAPSSSILPPEITRVQVRGMSRRVRIIGDPTVATVAVDGQHSVRRDGSTLHIAGESEVVPTDGAFVLLAGGRWREVADRFQNVGQALELRVRVRPDLAVGVEVIAGSLQVDGVPVLDHVRVTAGSLRVTGLQSPVDLLIQAGSAQVETRQLAGRSRMRCESGSLQLTLLDGSDVRVRSDVQLGRFATEPERRGRDRDRDVVLGTGAAEIDVEVVMGGVTVKLPSQAAA